MASVCHTWSTALLAGHQRCWECQHLRLRGEVRSCESVAFLLEMGCQCSNRYNCSRQTICVQEELSGAMLTQFNTKLRNASRVNLTTCRSTAGASCCRLALGCCVYQLKVVHCLFTIFEAPQPGACQEQPFHNHVVVVHMAEVHC